MSVVGCEWTLRGRKIWIGAGSVLRLVEAKRVSRVSLTDGECGWVDAREGLWEGMGIYIYIVLQSTHDAVRLRAHVTDTETGKLDSPS